MLMPNAIFEADWFSLTVSREGPLADSVGSKRVPKSHQNIADRAVNRGPGGELWAGRGARPNWLTALMKKGRKPEEFLIAKSARKGKA